MATMIVRKLPAETIRPCRETPHDVLYLSEIDCLCNCLVPVLTVYKGCRAEEKINPARVLKEALSKLLVYYYPLAGRLKNADGEGPGKLEVVCNADGVPFVEAEANCTLEDVGYFTKSGLAYNTSLAVQIDPQSPMEHNPLMALQVTRFQCGGFVIGVLLNHAILDGSGYSTFMQALVQTASNVISHSVLPVWERENLAPRDNLHIPYSWRDVFERKSSTATKFCTETLMFNGQFIDTLKAEIVRESKGFLTHCTAFEAAASLVWQGYLQAWEVLQTQSNNNNRQHQRVYCEDFCFVMDARKRFRPPLSEGYYGNGFTVCLIRNDDIEQGDSLGLKRSEIVKAMRKSKAKIDDEHMRSYIDYRREKRMSKTEVLPNTLVINDWTKISFQEDFKGAGKALSVVYLSPPATIPNVVLLPPDVETGYQKLILTLPQEVMPSFMSLITYPNAEWLEKTCIKEYLAGHLMGKL